MAENSKIEWTAHTFNPWWGCTKISPACTHCYADAFSRRIGKELWGPKAPRRFFGDQHWMEPVKWNRDAENQQARKRVFCSSMADVFEDRNELNEPRERLWGLIGRTPWLDWLLLTKRPENIEHTVPWKNDWPENVWLGTTVENQEYAEFRIPFLVKHPSRYRFLSSEPLLGPVDLSKWLSPVEGNRIDWVIAGGESGGKSRPMQPEWVRSLRDQCVGAGTRFHFKQWGNWVPSIIESGVEPMVRQQKKDFRLLDGRTWDEYPEAA